MRVSNIKEFYSFVEKNQITGADRFMGMYDTVERFCGGCRRSDYLRAILELKERYIQIVAAETSQWQNYVSKNTEKLEFYLDDVAILCFDIPNEVS